jgi:hypothetical protein
LYRLNCTDILSFAKLRIFRHLIQAFSLSPDFVFFAYFALYRPSATAYFFVQISLQNVQIIPVSLDPADETVLSHIFAILRRLTILHRFASHSTAGQSIRPASPAKVAVERFFLVC